MDDFESVLVRRLRVGRPLDAEDLAPGTLVHVLEPRSHFDGVIGRVIGPADDGDDVLVQLPREGVPLRFGRGALVVAAPGCAR